VFVMDLKQDTDCPATMTLAVRPETKFGLYCNNCVVYQASVFSCRYVNKHWRGNWKGEGKEAHLHEMYSRLVNQKVFHGTC
jgi:hypothetical protein